MLQFFPNWLRPSAKANIAPQARAARLYKLRCATALLPSPFVSKSCLCCGQLLLSACYIKKSRVMKKNKMKNNDNAARRRTYIYDMSKQELVLYGRYLRFCAFYCQNSNERSMYIRLLVHARSRFRNLYY